MKKITTKTLAVFMAALMLLSFTPLFASATTALKASNVSQYPTLSYKSADGKMYYGQTQSEALIINDDEIVLDANGSQVAGHFEFSNPDNIPSAGTGKKATIVFVPDDTNAYTGFKKLFSPLVYEVQKVTPILKDEKNPPFVDGTVEPGTALSSITISGGEMLNPYNATESELAQTVWQWSNPDTIVYESGEYEVVFDALRTAYDTITKMVYVEVASLVPVPEITENPIVDVFDFTPGKTWGEVEIKGGTATADGTEVDGTFAVTDEWKDVVAYPGTYEIDVVFTPEDETKALKRTFKITVTVNKAPITFETEDGTGVPTITVGYGTKTDDNMGNMLKQYVPEDVQIQYIDFYDLDIKPLEHANKTFDPGTYTLTCRGVTQNKNYAATMLTFKLVVTPITITPAIEGNGNSMIIRDVKGQYNPKGTFDLYVNNELVKSGIKYNEYFAYEHTTSGDKNFKAVYKPGDDNRYKIDPVTRADGMVTVSWNLSATGNDNKTVAYNTPVTVTAPATDPEKPDKPYYGFAGWEAVKGGDNFTEEQLKNAEITFTMPDENVELKANYKFSLKLFFEWILDQIARFFTFIVNAVKDIIAMI